jgi:hypothetical protein
MSIDREVNALKEAYSGNIQALKDRYVQNKKLVELLALQSMKSDLDEKQNNIARMMNTNPATIKQQREKEVFARTAEDVAQQVGGTLKNMQRQRSQGIQRLAQRAAAPQRGLGALMPQQRQRPQKRMMAATGGIVGFDGRDGSRVSGPLAEFERIDKDSTYTPPDLLGLAEQADIEELIRRGLLPKNFKGSLSAERAKEMLSRPTSQEPKTVDTPPPVETKPPTQDKTEGIAAIAEPEIPTANNALVLRSQQNVSTDTAPKDDTAPSGSGTASTEPEPFDLQARLDEVGDAPTPVKVDRTGLEKSGVDFTKAYGVDPKSIDPEEAGIEALTKAGGFYGIKQKDAERRKGLTDLAAIDAAQTDPEKLRREQLIDFLLGGAGRGRSALAAAGAAAVNRERAQGRDIRRRQIKRNEMLKDIQNQDLEIRKLAKGEQRAAIERADNLKMEGLRIISTMSNEELRARTAETTALNNRNIANYQAKMERVGLMLEQSNAEADQAIARAQLASLDAQRRGQIAQSGIDDAMRRKTEIGQILSKTIDEQVAGDQALLNLRSQLNPDLSTTEREGIINNIKLRRKEIIQAIMIDHSDLYTELGNLDDRILKLKNLRDSVLSGGITDIPVSPEVEDAIARNQN